MTTRPRSDTIGGPSGGHDHNIARPIVVDTIHIDNTDPNNNIVPIDPSSNVPWHGGPSPSRRASVQRYEVCRWRHARRRRSRRHDRPHWRYSNY